MHIISTCRSVLICIMGHRRITDRVGQRNGRLLIVENLIPSDGYKNRGGTWKCVCDCGNTRTTYGYGFSQIYSCGCLRSEHNQKEGVNKRRYEEVTINAYYRRYRYDCKSRNLIPLDKDNWFQLVSQPCIYCGQTQERNEATAKWYNVKARENLSDESLLRYTCKLNGIDRIDSSRGYELDNCAPCCAKCNKMKLHYEVDDFLDHVKRICQYQHAMNCEKVPSLILT